MAEIEERSKQTVVQDTGNTRVVKEQVSSEATADSRQIGVNIVWYVAGIVLVMLAIRFVLKLIGANPNSGFVDLIYSITGVLVAPFTGIFSTPTTEGDVVRSVFETATIVAMIVYGLIAWGLARLFTLNQPEA